MKIENPFSDKGERIPAKYFIGRVAEIRNGQPTNIENSIFKYKPLSPLAIIGIPGIGKSSLAHKAITERKDELSDRKVFPIEITVFPNDTSQGFFRKFVIKCVEEMEKVGRCTREVKESKDSLVKTLSNIGDHTLPQSEIESFFQTVKTTEYHPLFILDRFDFAQSAFKDTNAFYFLNKLTQELEVISLVLIARQDIAKIEDNAGSASAFNRLFHQPIRLSMFSEMDLEAYFSKLEAVHEISTDEKENIRFHCGAHPYLLQKLGFQIVKRLFETNLIDVSQSIQDMSNTFSSYYERLITFLKEVNLLNPLLQVLYGVGLPEDLYKLEDYGLIEKTESGSYVAYSEHFHEYLQKLSAPSPKPSHTPGPIATSSRPITTYDLTQPVTIKFIENEVVPFTESHDCEFKEITLKPDPRANSSLHSFKDNAERYAVAFLNCEGGSIFWGINDRRKTVGVRLIDKQDEVERLVAEKLSGIRPKVTSPLNYQIKFHPVYASASGTLIKDLWIVQLAVRTQDPSRVYYMGGNADKLKLIVRDLSVTKELSGPDADTFILERYKLRYES